MKINWHKVGIIAALSIPTSLVVVSSCTQKKEDTCCEVKKNNETDKQKANKIQN